MIETRIRFDVRLSDNRDVFSICISPYKCEEFEAQDISLEPYRNQFEIIIHGEIKGFFVVFEEHQEWITNKIEIPSEYLGKRLGIVCTEVPNPNDYITYAGCFAYKHPLITLCETDYYSIIPERSFDMV